MFLGVLATPLLVGQKTIQSWQKIVFGINKKLVPVLVNCFELPQASPRLFGFAGNIFLWYKFMQEISTPLFL